MLHMIKNVQRVEDCLARAAAEDVVVLYEAAVFAGCREDLTGKLDDHPARVCFLKEDCLARGIAEETEPDIQIDYAQLVQLTVDHAPQYCWR